MLQSLSTDLLAHILQHVVGPLEEMCVGGDSSALVLPVMLGADCRELRELRTVCKGFQDALRTVPLHVIASTIRQVRSLPLLHTWDIAAVRLNSSTGRTSELLIKAACALPDRERNKIVTVTGIPGERVFDLAPRLRQLDGVRHVNVMGSTNYLECLSYMTRLDLTRLSLDPIEVDHLLERLCNLPNLQSLRFIPGLKDTCWMSSDALAQFPALRVLELCNNVYIKSPGTFEEAVEKLEGSSLQELKIHIMENSTSVLWMVQQNEQGRRGCVELLDSLRLRKCFSCTLEFSDSGIGPREYVLRRRCAKDLIVQEIAACKGPGLVLDTDLSMQLVLHPELQALVREAGLSVELRCDRPCLPLLRDDWLRLSVPVLSVRWYTGNADAWGILDECAWPARGVAAIHDVQLPFVGDGDTARRFAAKFCNLHVKDASVQALRGCAGTQITMLGQAGVVVGALPNSLNALPKSCEWVNLEWADDGTVGETAGLGACAHIKRLCLYNFRVTELPPSLAHLELTCCNLEGLVLPAGLQLRSLLLEYCNRPKAIPLQHRSLSSLFGGAEDEPEEQIRAPIRLLDWLEKTQPQATVQVSVGVLTLGALSMEQYALRLSELATRSINLEGCTLQGHDGRLSTHSSVADMADYMEQHTGRRVAVQDSWVGDLPDCKLQS